jgi:uncharacterized Zn-binding protein involved in type VI secretion
VSRPAAKMNDKIVGLDIHIILIPSPGGPIPTPIPHPYTGAITINTSPTVMIAGMPAATVGSMSVGQPPHIPMGGPFQIPPTNIGKIEMGSVTVQINGKGAARLGDPATTCNDVGMMWHSQVIGAGTVLIGG